MTALDEARGEARPAPGTGDGSWNWWPEVVVRGAGFPSEGVLRLADGLLAARADAVAAAGPDDAAAWAAYREAYGASWERVGSELRGIAGSDAFRTAVTWQNHRLVAGALDPFLRWRPGEDSRHSKHRQREELVASYWQRYCVKNDSIGFFGPVGWGRITGGPVSRADPGPRLVDTSEVFFESWAVDALAGVLGDEPGMREWLPPRRLPFARLDGDRMVPPVGPPVPLSPGEVRVLAACDGRTAARDLPAATGVPLPELLPMLEAMVRRRWVAWTVELPVGPRPELDLRALLERVGDPELRAGALDRLDRLEAARDAVAASAGPVPLEAALGELDQVFTGITGADSTRHAGRTYGGRTLAYADSHRDVDVELGTDVMAAAAPVELLVDSARWFCWRLARTLRETLGRIHDGLGGGPVDLTAFWMAALRPLRSAVLAGVGELGPEFTARWASVLGLPAEGTRVHRTLAELRPRVAEAFAAPGCGWSAARWMSPDVMVAARDVAALRAGDFQIVLGELHMAINTQRSHCFVTQHPRPDRLFDCLDADFPEPRLLPVLPKSSPPRLSVRTHPAMARERDFMVEFHHHTLPADRPRLVHSRDVRVVRRGPDLLAELPGGPAFDVLDVFSEQLLDAVIDQFRVLVGGSHSPRITVDKVVVSRERWTVDAAGLAFAKDTDEARRYVAVRAWAASLGLPRQLFVKPPEEKPVYLDLDSPLYVNLLAKILRRAAQGEGPTDRAVTFVEMLPSLDQLWLVDAEGRRYTSELRFALVDRYGVA